MYGLKTNNNKKENVEITFKEQFRYILEEFR